MNTSLLRGRRQTAREVHQIEEDAMSLSRRAFVKTLGIGAGVLSTRFALPGTSGFGLESVLHAQGAPIPLHNNENPLGPGEAAIEAMRAVLGADGARTGRYPGNVAGLVQAISAKFDVAPENVMIGCGSTEILRTATQVFTSKTKHLVGGSPTYEECVGYAALIGTPVRAVPLDKQLRLDLAGMAAVSKGAGFIFINNPNNPTATIQPVTALEGFISDVLKASPSTTIMLDEAYFDYVVVPGERSLLPLAVKNPRVIVARTFSKAYGMAGLRVGFVVAHPDTIKVMRAWQGGQSVNVLGIAAATASLKDQKRIDDEVKRNDEARRFTMDWFKAHGMESTESHANFIFVNIKRPARGFRDGCRANGVLVGRDFPPYANTHCRISIGTLEEMKRATEVFGKVLGTATTAAAAA
jgi:histidinol-phosphate aminotransferase